MDQNLGLKGGYKVMFLGFWVSFKGPPFKGPSFKGPSFEGASGASGAFKGAPKQP